MVHLEEVAIIGMGYVGLTLAAVLAKKGYHVSGIETDGAVLHKLREGEPHFKETGLQSLLRHMQRIGRLEVLDVLPKRLMDAYVISVGTPLLKGSKEPNIDYIQNAITDVAEHMHPSALVMLRSTVPVGLSRNLVVPKIESVSGLKVGTDFSYAFAPERTIEGKALIELEQNPQIIGGYDERSVALASDFFRPITPTILAVSSIEAAEMIKIIDNTYRDVRFAYANEVALLAEKLGLDAAELISAANTHYPRNSIPVPSPGVGGACLSKDPHIMRYFSLRHGYDPRLIKEARDINERIPQHIVDRVQDVLAGYGKELASSKVFVVGFAFKGEPETSDLRDSTTLWFLDELKRHVATVHGYDPVVPGTELARLGVTPCSLEEGIGGADAVFFMNNHRSYAALDPYALTQKMRKPAVFYDAGRMFQKQAFEGEEGIRYLGVGL